MSPQFGGDWPASERELAKVEAAAQRQEAARARSEESQAVTQRVVYDLGAQPEAELKPDVRPVAEHMAALGGEAFLSHPAVLSASRRMRPTPQQLRDQEIQRQEALREEVRADYRDSVYERASANIEAEVENMSAEELETYYNEGESVQAAADPNPDEWTTHDQAEYDVDAGLEQDLAGNEAAYHEEQAKLAAQAEEHGDEAA